MKAIEHFIQVIFEKLNIDVSIETLNTLLLSINNLLKSTLSLGTLSGQQTMDLFVIRMYKCCDMREGEKKNKNNYVPK